MVTQERPTVAHGLRSWRTLVCLVLLAMLCRAAIPVGYMPGMDARDGSFTLVLCTADGSTMEMAVDLADGEPFDAATVLDCPFGLLAAPAALPDPGVPPSLWLALSLPSPVQLLRHSLPPLPATGPPLGSRAPPILSA